MSKVLIEILVVFIKSSQLLLNLTINGNVYSNKINFIVNKLREINGSNVIYMLQRIMNSLTIYMEFMLQSCFFC